MLGDETALAVEQAELAAVTQFPHHRAGRMRHVGVERSAEERQPAGHGRLHVGAEAECPPRHLRYAGKAAIQFDGVEFFAVALDQIHHRFQHRILRMAFVELVTHQIVARLFCRCAAPDIDQAILGHAGRAGFCQ